MSAAFNKMSVGDLKARLKTIGMSQAGDKGTLIYRLQMNDRCVSKGLTSLAPSTGSQQNPCCMKFPDLKVAAAKLGVSPIGTQDEILAAVVDALERAPASASASDGHNEGTSIKDGAASGKGEVDPIAIARRVLELNEMDDYEGILNIATPQGAAKIDRQSSVAAMRKNYLKLSLVIHPDKLGRTFDQATKAFQALVTAFDRLSSPDLVLAEAQSGNKKSGKAPTISRSNEGCYRTRVCCPRCKQSWNEGSLDGNPDYCYNFLMMGLKCYTCSTCLFEFGCMTAVHRCPHCNGDFEYSPQDYHRKLVCGRKKCGKSFGFLLYNCSDRVMNEMRKDVKEEQERRLKAREAKQRRAARMSGRGGFDEEKAFLMGLVDCCPRCGESFEGYPDEETQRMHLMECTDTRKHAAHSEKKADDAKKLEEKQKKRDVQESVQTAAVWSFLGGETSQLWILSEDQLRQQAEEAKLNAIGDKDELISRIAAHRRGEETTGGNNKNSSRDDGKPSSSSSSSSSSSALVTKNTNNALVVSKKRPRITANDLPTNMHSMSAEQLRSVCAANGLLHLLPKKEVATKYDILRILERELYGEDVVISDAQEVDSSKKVKADDPDFTFSPLKGGADDDDDADVIIL